jgi:hypothetical protein
MEGITVYNADTKERGDVMNVFYDQGGHEFIFLVEVFDGTGYHLGTWHAMKCTPIHA